MKINERKTSIGNLMPPGFMLCFYIFSFSILVCMSGYPCWAVTSKVTRHSSSVDLLAGETDNTIVDSKGTIRLGRVAESLAGEFENVWSINTIVVSGGSVYLGTSPNGGVYKYSLGELNDVYQAEVPKSQSAEPDSNEPNAVSGEPNIVEREKYLANEHIFAMATDISGRLLVGISGRRCVLCRLEAEQMKTIFEPNDAKYIFAIAVDDSGEIYLGTGPEGKVYKLDSNVEEAQLIYDSTDKNILSLAIGNDGFVYAGSDNRGLVYKIDPRARTATVLYDSDQPEITALMFSRSGRAAPTTVKDIGGEDLYAAATLAKIIAAQTKFASEHPFAGRPEPESPAQAKTGANESGLKLEVANTKKEAGKEPAQRPAPAREPSKPGKASYIYRITGDGFVSEIFSEAAVFFCLTEQDEKLFIGTGNNGRFFSVEPATEEKAIIYEDKEASQITAAVVVGDDIYLGTANPAKLILLRKAFAFEGSYTSKLIDASQPARWGKLQIEADIPEGSTVLASCRSGNVKDVNDPTFSEWTEPQQVTGPIETGCPAGRFCQYKLILKSPDGERTPVVREIAVASAVANLAPKVESVTISRVETAGQAGVFQISYKTKDDNDDKLIYKIDFRKITRTSWIELEDDIEKDSFEWDGKTVEDGRYELRVTASDERSNTDATKLTGSRISEPVVVDNTGPVIKRSLVRKEAKKVTLELLVSDELSAIGSVNYTVDSNKEWIGAVPDDLVYDTTNEDFTIVIEDLKPGEHIISVKAADDVGNTTYKTFDVSIKDN